MSGKTIVLITLMAFMCCAGLFGQTYARKIEDFGQPTALTSTDDDGHLLVSSGNGTLVRKVNPNGKRVWQKLLETSAELNAAVQLSNGTYIVAGSEFFAENPYFFSKRGVLVNLKSNGRTNWEMVVASTTDDEIFGPYSEGGFESVVALRDGFVAAGRPWGGRHINVASFDSDGNIRWAQLFSIHSYSYSDVRVVKAQDQNLIIASVVTDNDTGKNAGWFVFKIDSQGKAIWAKLLQQNGQQLRSLTISPNGEHLILTGFRARKKTTAYAIALDANGNLEWKKRFKIGSQATIGIAAAATTDNGFIIGGYAKGRGFITKLDASGKIQSAVGTDPSPDFMLTHSDSGYTLFGNDQTGTVIARIDSNLNLPGCDLFQPAKIVSLKFGAVKISEPQLQSVPWSPTLTKLNLRSTTVNKSDSQLCP